MTERPFAAAGALADLLARENAALEAADLPAAAALLPAKRAAAEALVRSCAASDTLAADARLAARDALARLESEMVRNRSLLARAIRVQGRLVALLAGAVPARQTTYGATPSRVASRSPVAMSLRA